jgi:hypothetical protein
MIRSKMLLTLLGDGEATALPDLAKRHRIAVEASSAAILPFLLSRFRAPFKRLSSNSRAGNLSLRKKRKVN